MCKTCDKIKSPKFRGDGLKEIAKAIKAGVAPEHFKNLMDSLLNTEMEERDKELENVWEINKRREQT